MAVKGKQKGKAKEEEVLEVEDESKKSSNKRIIIIAAVLLGIGVSAIAGYFFIGGDKETTTEVAGIENKKVQSIYFRLEKPLS